MQWRWRSSADSGWAPLPKRISVGVPVYRCDDCGYFEIDGFVEVRSIHQCCIVFRLFDVSAAGFVACTRAGSLSKHAGCLVTSTSAADTAVFIERPDSDAEFRHSIRCTPRLHNHQRRALTSDTVHGLELHVTCMSQASDDSESLPFVCRGTSESRLREMPFEERFSDTQYHSHGFVALECFLFHAHGVRCLLKH